MKKEKKVDWELSFNEYKKEKELQVNNKFDMIYKSIMSKQETKEFLKTK